MPPLESPSRAVRKAPSSCVLVLDGTILGFFFLILLSVSSFGGRPSDSSADGGGGGGGPSGEAGRRNSARELPSADFGEKRQNTFFLVTMNTNAFHLLMYIFWRALDANKCAAFRAQASRRKEKEESRHLSLFNHRSSRSKLTFYTNYRIQQTKITYSFSKSSGGEREHARAPPAPQTVSILPQRGQ